MINLAENSSNIQVNRPNILQSNISQQPAVMQPSSLQNPNSIFFYLL